MIFFFYFYLWIHIDTIRFWDTLRTSICITKWILVPNTRVTKCQNLNCSIRIGIPWIRWIYAGWGSVTLEYTISKFRSHRVRSHGSTRSRCINAPLRYAEYAKNEVKRNRTLRCSREDCSSGREREIDRENAGRRLHSCARREHYIVVQN